MIGFAQVDVTQFDSDSLPKSVMDINARILVSALPVMISLLEGQTHSLLLLYSMDRPSSEIYKTGNLSTLEVVRLIN